MHLVYSSGSTTRYSDPDFEMAIVFVSMSGMNVSLSLKVGTGVSLKKLNMLASSMMGTSKTSCIPPSKS